MPLVLPTYLDQVGTKLGATYREQKKKGAAMDTRKSTTTEAGATTSPSLTSKAKTPSEVVTSTLIRVGDGPKEPSLGLRRVLDEIIAPPLSAKELQDAISMGTQDALDGVKLNLSKRRKRLMN